VEPIWVAAAAVVFIASVVQTVTGAGLGLMAGPVLLIAMGSTDAVQVAVVLNLALSLALFPREGRSVPRKPLGWLVAGALAGLPLGIYALHAMEIQSLKLLAGITVSAGGLQMLLARKAKTNNQPYNRLTGFGLVAGAMTAALAIPGPVALWGLSRTTLNVAEIRATLRAFFIFAYGICVVGYLVRGAAWDNVLMTSGWLGIPLGLGMVTGMAAQRQGGEAWLRRAFVVLVLAMGAALLIEVTWNWSG
jgi:uncharacterized membrane protein YfcA